MPCRLWAGFAEMHGAGVEGEGGKCVAGDDDCVGQGPDHEFLLAMLRTCINNDQDFRCIRIFWGLHILLKSSNLVTQNGNTIF